MSTTPVPTLIDQLSEAALAAKAATTEARQAAKDLRAAAKEAREAEASLRRALTMGAQESATEAVAAVLAEETPKLVKFVGRTVEARADRRILREISAINVALDRIAKESGATIRTALTIVPVEGRAG